SLAWKEHQQDTCIPRTELVVVTRTHVIPAYEDVTSYYDPKYISAITDVLMQTTTQVQYMKITVGQQPQVNTRTKYITLPSYVSSVSLITAVDYEYLSTKKIVTEVKTVDDTITHTEIVAIQVTVTSTFTDVIYSTTEEYIAYPPIGYGPATVHEYGQHSAPAYGLSPVAPANDYVPVFAPAPAAPVDYAPTVVPAPVADYAPVPAHENFAHYAPTPVTHLPNYLLDPVADPVPVRVPVRAADYQPAPENVPVPEDEYPFFDIVPLPAPVDDYPVVPVHGRAQKDNEGSLQGKAFDKETPPPLAEDSTEVPALEDNETTDETIILPVTEDSTTQESSIQEDNTETNDTELLSRHIRDAAYGVGFAQAQLIPVNDYASTPALSPVDYAPAPFAISKSR
ncbi:hypothetical protein SK128_000417, partial [Halocaridina rubra]